LRGCKTGLIIRPASTVKIAIMRKQKKLCKASCFGETYGQWLRKALVGKDKKGAGHGRRGKSWGDKAASNR
jgi:hypothetical protein